MTGPQPVLVTLDDTVLVITLNRPEALNAVNATVAAAVGDALERASTDERVRVVVVTGTGRAFCAGMDLKAYARGEDVAAPGRSEWGFAGLTQHFVDKPVIAAVNGLALGGGCEIVLACDLALASTAASFGLPEVKRGLLAGGGGVFRLPRLLPRRVATEMILTGEPIPAADALRYGLVNRVVAPDQLLAQTLDLARAICANGPLAVRASKRLLTESFRHGADWDEDIWQLNDRVTAEVLASDDGKEGALAFAQKRPPAWTGH
jgi:crotonobetainyl-CoA hydratase